MYAELSEIDTSLRVTIIMTQRERFDLVTRSIESLYGSTEWPFHLIYVDGASSLEIHRETEALSSQYGFQIVRREYFLPPNIARNLAIEVMDRSSDYIVFVDNDVIFEKDWLEALLRCADKTGAAVVSPLIMIGNPDRPESVRIHFAGGHMTQEETAAGIKFGDTHNHGDQKLAAVEGLLKRAESDSFEFHAVMVRNDILTRIAPLDEGLRATSEHLDLSLQLEKLGEKIVFEPDSVVTYIVGKPLAKHESLFFMVRWSDYWALYSERHFQEKWGFCADQRVVDNFVVDHRLHAFSNSLKWLERFLGYTYSRKLLAGWYRHKVRKAKRYALPETLTL